MKDSKVKNGDDYLARLENFQRHDKERDDLVKEIAAKYQDLEQRFEKKCKEYEDEAQTRALYQAQANKANKKLIAIKHETEVHPFVIAIIDGDEAIFHEDWIAKGEEGGAMAAHQLRTDIEKHIKALHPVAKEAPWDIIVQVVLNLEGVARKLHKVDLYKGTSLISAFSQGFCQAQGLFSIVDVGKNKKQADFKLCEMLRVMADNLHCKCIIFGPCQDDGYKIELKPYLLGIPIFARLSLLETTPPPHGFQEVGLRRVRFPDVFRSEALPVEPPRNVSASPSTKSEPKPSITPPWNGTNSLITGFKRSMSLSSEKATKPVNFEYYLVNSSGERIDEPLPKVSEQAEKRYYDRGEKEKRGACNNYHLYGACEKGCTYYHGVRLDADQQLVHRRRTRGTPCIYNPCKNPRCYWAHHCMRGKKCLRPRCRFAETHDMDLTPFEKVYSDGSREKVSSKEEDWPRLGDVH